MTTKNQQSYKDGCRPRSIFSDKLPTEPPAPHPHSKIFFHSHFANTQSAIAKIGKYTLMHFLKAKATQLHQKNYGSWQNKIR